jgi:hypothetical protein
MAKTPEQPPRPDPAPEKSPVNPSQEGVPVMITRSMHQQLEVLGYSKGDRSKLTPQEAWDLLNTSTPKPPAEEAPVIPPAAAALEAEEQDQIDKNIEANRANEKTDSPKTASSDEILSRLEEEDLNGSGKGKGHATSQVPVELLEIFRKVPTQVLEKYEKIKNPKVRNQFIANLKIAQQHQAERENERPSKERPKNEVQEQKGVTDPDEARRRQEEQLAGDLHAATERWPVYETELRDALSSEPAAEKEEKGKKGKKERIKKKEEKEEKKEVSRRRPRKGEKLGDAPPANAQNTEASQLQRAGEMVTEANKEIVPDYDMQRQLLETKFKSKFPTPDLTNEEYVQANKQYTELKRGLARDFDAHAPEKTWSPIADFLRGIGASTEIPSAAAKPVESQARSEVPEQIAEMSPEAVPDYVQEAVSKDFTPAEHRRTLSHLVNEFGRLGKETFKSYASSSAELIRRTRELDTEAEKIGITEKGFRKLGEFYNRRGWKSKLAIGAGLGLGAGIGAAAAFLPAIIAFGGAIALQRTAGLATMYLKFEKDALEGEKWGKEKAMGKAILYTAGMTAGMAYLVKEVSESKWAQPDALKQTYEETLEWLSRHFGEQDPSLSGESHIPVAPAAPGETIAGSIEGSATEIPSITVRAQGGYGYEYMLKRMWEQLHEKGLDPAKYPEGTDIRRLLDAKPENIDRVVHIMATDSGFYRPDGTSAAVGKGDILAFNTEGNVLHTTPDGTSSIHAPTQLADEGPVPQEYIDAHEKVPLPAEEEPKSEAAQAEPKLPAEPISKSGGLTADSLTLPQPEDSTVPATESASETIVPSPDSPPPLPVEHTKEFLNKNNIVINPLEGHVYQDGSGAALAYGNDFAARFNAAQEFARANPEMSVWVQAEKPVFYEGAWRPWVMEVRYGGFFRGVHVLNPDGPPDASHIGAVLPETFINRLDK